MSKKPKPLTPPDPERCQAEIPNGYSFMTLGGSPGRVRCPNKPCVIATEVKPGPDGQHGSMSLCASCLKVFQKQMGPDYATFKAPHAVPCQDCRHRWPRITHPKCLACIHAGWNGTEDNREPEQTP